jgi:hypothetical protein
MLILSGGSVIMKLKKLALVFLGFLWSLGSIMEALALETTAVTVIVLWGKQGSMRF